MQSDIDSSYYIGYTHVLEARIKQHNDGKSIYTKCKLPWKLVYSESFPTKREAIQREGFLKKQRNRAFYNKLIATFTTGI